MEREKQETIENYQLLENGTIMHKMAVDLLKNIENFDET